MGTCFTKTDHVTGRQKFYHITQEQQNSAQQSSCVILNDSESPSPQTETMVTVDVGGTNVDMPKIPEFDGLFLWCRMRHHVLANGGAEKFRPQGVVKIVSAYCSESKAVL